LTPSAIGDFETTSTFIGYQIQGFPGAALATLGIFFPLFIFVLILNPIVPNLRESGITANFLDAVNISAVAIMVAVVIKMGSEVLLDLCNPDPETGILKALFHRSRELLAAFFLAP